MKDGNRRNAAPDAVKPQQRGGDRARPTFVRPKPIHEPFPPIDDMPEPLFGRPSEMPDSHEPVMQDYEGMSDEELTYLKPTKINDDSLWDSITVDNFNENALLRDVVGIKLHPSDPISMFDCRDMYFTKGDRVVVETKRGLTLGEVAVATKRRFIQRDDLPRVIRMMSPGDFRQQERNRDKQDAAYRLCKDRIERLRLPMKLVEVEYLHGGNKAVFYFSAEGRVDFRELVRDLAQRLHTRIEMRQIGVRDVPRVVGGIGICGCQLCCNLYLREFKPISIRMAKDQNLVLNPQKVSGVCGRLLCCLTYENTVYREAAQGMPRVGRRIKTPDGIGRIRDRDVLKKIVRVQLDEETNLREYFLDQLDLNNRVDDGLNDNGSDDNGDFDEVMPADDVEGHDVIKEDWPPDDSNGSA